MGELQTAMLDTGNVEADWPATPLSALDSLRTIWLAVLEEPNPAINDDIKVLTNCSVVSIRYALLTQLLGKFADHNRDALSIQRREATNAELAGRWDARSFCQANVVPWIREAGQVLGTSTVSIWFCRVDMLELTASVLGGKPPVYD